MTLSDDIIARLAKQQDQHKYDHGHAVVLAGGPGRGGAARLAARGALRVGAGLVTVVCPAAALAENAGRLDAIMCRPMEGARGLNDALADQRLNAICAGPGLGLDEDAGSKVLALLQARRATVLDADALSLVGQVPGLREALHPRVVLTPHAGEYARVFGDALLEDAAREAGCTILLKGPVTQIVGADVRMAEVEAKAPWLATAGSGDVLAGIITGLLARGFVPFEAAQTGAWLHGAAARAFGPGLIAEDLPETLPGVFRELGL